VPQARADLVDLELVRGALFALFGLVGALLQAALRDDAGALRERSGDVLSEITPHASTEEERFAVFPLVGLTVERTGSGGDGEVRDGESALRVAQLGVARQIADDRDDGVSGHDLLSTLRGS